MKTHTCCEDDFSTLSWKLRCLTAISVIFSTFCFLCLAIYYFLLRDDTSMQDAMLLSQPEAWVANCPEIPVDPEDRIDCYPENSDVSQDSCVLRGCCWVNSTGPAPKCYYPSNRGYRAVTQKTLYDGFEVLLTRLPTPSRYGDDIQDVRMKVEMQTSTRLRIKFYDAESERYEVRTPLIPVEKSAQDPGYDVPLYAVTHNIIEEPYSVKVRRVATDDIIFGVYGHSLTISNQFLEVTAKLPSENVYGFGEHFHVNYKRSVNWRKWGMFSSDVIDQDCNMHGVHPVYMCMESNGSSHGVLLLNSNAMEVLLQPTPAVTFRTIGGVLDFYIFLGPTPEDVIKQYTEAVGRPMMPPYWALGYQVGQKGRGDFGNLISKLKRMRSKDVAQDILYMETEPGSNNGSDLLTLLQDVKLQQQRSVLLMTPDVSKEDEYIGGLGSGIFVNNTWGIYPFIGKTTSENVSFLDFGNLVTEVWWQEKLRLLQAEIPFSGIWLGNNVPLNLANESGDECYQDNLNKPPFIPAVCQDTLYERTLCMDAVQYWKEKKYKHYDLHNLYGHLMATATYSALKKLFEDDQPLICTQSTFIGTGKFSGHWIDQEIDTWQDMKKLIPAILEFNIFGIPYVGINICTSNIINDMELCMKQIQLGAFYPLSFSFLPETTKASLPSTVDLDYITREALRRRYELLPYLYTLFHYAHINGSTVARPLFHEFPRDEETYHIDQQFLWGESLLISPVLEKGVKSILSYLPKGIWYDYYNGKKYQLENGEWIKMPYQRNHSSKPVNLHIRGGHIIPTQQAANTTNISRKQPMGLIVALNSTNEAEGTLFWDDGITKESYPDSEYVKVGFVVSKNILIIEGKTGDRGYHSFEPHIQHVRIMGLSHKPLRITIGNAYSLQKKHLRWDNEYKLLQLRHIAIPLSGKTIVQWFL